MDIIERAARAAYKAAHYAGPLGNEPIVWGRGGYATEVIQWRAVAMAVLKVAAPQSGKQ